MFDDYGNSLESSGSTDWLAGLTGLATAAAGVYRTVSAPETAAGPAPVKPAPVGGAGLGGFSPWAIGAAALALLVGLVLLVRR